MICQAIVCQPVENWGRELRYSPSELITVRRGLSAYNDIRLSLMPNVSSFARRPAPLDER